MERIGPERYTSPYSAGATAVTCGKCWIFACNSRQFSMPPEGSFSSTLMCAMAPSRLRCSVLRKPLFTASAIISAMTPAATPTTEMAVMTEITASFRRARR